MVSQFTQQPVNKVQTKSHVKQLKIRRLKNSELKLQNYTTPSVQLQQFTGLPKPIPQPLLFNPPSLKEACQSFHSVIHANERDYSWLTHLNLSAKPVDWSGFNSYEDRKKEHTSKQSHLWYLDL